MTAIACPNCGGTERKLLAPGFFECVSEVLDDVIPAGMQGNAADVPLYRICGYRYQGPNASISAPAGGAPAQCSCGMFAVGACVRCDEPVCGQHAATRQGRVLCPAHAQEEAAAAARKAEEEKQQRLKAHRRATEEWEAQAVAALSAVSDPTERNVRALTEIRYAQTDPLKRMIPRSIGDRQIAAWFLATVKSSPTKQRIFKTTVFGTSKELWRRGWYFSEGSKSIKNYPHGHQQPGSITILEDGRIYYDRSFEPDRDDGFNDKALREIVELVGLRPLDLPPRPENPEVPHYGFIVTAG